MWVKKKNKIEEPVIHPNWELAGDLKLLLEKYNKIKPSCDAFVNPKTGDNVEDNIHKMLLWYTEQYFKLICDLKLNTPDRRYCGGKEEKLPQITINRKNYSKIIIK